MSGNFLALVPLAAPAVLKSDALVAQLERLRPVGSTSKITVSGSSNDLILAIGSSMLSIMTIDQPVPLGTFDIAIERGMLWPDARSVLDRHKAHIVIGTMNAGTTLTERVAAATDIMWVCAAVASITPCLGVHWVSGETVCAKDNFLASFKVMARDKLPLTIWLRFNLFAGPPDRGQSTVGCVTTGLAAFMGREIEFAATPLPMETVVNLALAIAQYALNEGTSIKHGETFAIGPKQSMRVELADNGRVLAAPVYHVSPAA